MNIFVYEILSMCRHINVYMCYVKLKYIHYKYIVFTVIDFIIYFYLDLFVYLFAGLLSEGSKAEDKLKSLSSVK